MAKKKKKSAAQPGVTSSPADGAGKAAQPPTGPRRRRSAGSLSAMSSVESLPQFDDVATAKDPDFPDPLGPASSSPATKPAKSSVMRRVGAGDARWQLKEYASILKERMPTRSKQMEAPDSGEVKGKTTWQKIAPKRKDVLTTGIIERRELFKWKDPENPNGRIGVEVMSRDRDTTKHLVRFPDATLSRTKRVEGELTPPGVGITKNPERKIEGPGETKAPMLASLDSPTPSDNWDVRANTLFKENSFVRPIPDKSYSFVDAKFSGEEMEVKRRKWVVEYEDDGKGGKKKVKKMVS